MKSLREEDINDLKYIWEYKEDLERLSTFEKLKPIIKESNPEILKAWEDYKTSKRILDIIIDSL